MEEINAELIGQITDDELQELLSEEADLDLELPQVALLRQFIIQAGDLELALEMLEAVLDDNESKAA